MSTSPSSGFTAARQGNLGQVRNSGIELLFTANPVSLSRFAWNSRVNVSTNHNELVTFDIPGKATDIPIPALKPEQPKGNLEIELEPDQKHVWLAMMYQAGIAQIDRSTHEVKAYAFPKEWQSTSAQASMVSPQHADVDGKVWTNNQDTHYMYRLDLKTGQFENLGPSKDLRGKQISAYGMPTDYQNNVYQL